MKGGAVVADLKTNVDDGNASQFDNEPSSLDEQTHAEMILLYKESTDTMRFAKHLQWWTVGSTLFTFAVIIAIAKLVSADKGFANTLTWVVILLTMCVIFTLSVYQFWQHTEHLKVREISKHMSTLFKTIRQIKSRREANIHRYVLLFFMISTVILGAVVTHFGLDQVQLSRYR